MKRILLIGTVLFAILSIASIWLYRERVLYVDSAYYAFNMYNTGFPAAEHNRYALYIYQFIPWLMMKMELSVPMVLRAYSISHILIHAIVFFILLKMKRPGLAVLLLLMQVIGYRECFFLTVNETALAISASILLAALLDSNPNNINPIVRYIAFFLCILIALYSHPMAMILIPFVIAYQLSNNIRSRQVIKDSLIIFGIFIIIFLIKKLTGKTSGYEDDLFSQLKNTFNIIGNLNEVYSFKFFQGDFKLQSYFFKVFILPLIAFVVICFKLFKDKKNLKLAFYMISSVGFWLLIVVLFNRGDGNIFMEKNFTPWIMVVFYPIIDLMNFEKNDLTLKNSAVVISIILFSLWGINEVRPMYSKRLYLMDQLITEKNPGKSKLLIQDSTVNHDEWLGIWALPYETLLLSKLKGIPHVSAKIYRNEDHINKELNRTDIFLGADFIPVLPASYLLNQKEFKLKEEQYFLIEKP